MKNKVNLSAYGHGFFQDILGFMNEIEIDNLSKKDVEYFIKATLRQSNYLKKNPNLREKIRQELKKRGCKDCGK